MKFLIVPTGLLCMFIIGVYGYRFLNRKIMNSKGVLEILFYSVAMFAALCILSFGGLFVIAEVYGFLMSSE
ncbi:MAG: hypothetical protein QM764_14790 [Chitinophagaceae bacterium]